MLLARPLPIVVKVFFVYRNAEGIFLLNDGGDEK